MGIARILLPWDSQPQEVVELNRSSLFSAGAKSVVLGGSLVDLAGSDTWAIFDGAYATIASAGRSWKSTNVNPFSGVAGKTGFHSYVPTSAPIALLVRFRVVALGSTGYMLADGNSGGAGHSIGVVQHSTNTYRALIPGTTLISSTAVTLGDHTLLFVWEGSNAKMWIDGKLEASATGVTARSTGAGKVTLLRYGDYKASLGTSCDVYFAGISELAMPTDTYGASLTDNPWQLFAPRSIWIPVSAGGGGISGTLATTNANDTSAASGTTTVLGTLARTNANDTSAANGTTTILGTVAATNGDDTCAASGTVGSSGSTGTVNYTNANDTAAATGTTTVTGTVARSNADDSVSASGWVGAITGTLAYTNDDDTLSASGTAAGPSQAAVIGGGGYLPSFRRKTRKEIHAERVRLGILPEQIRKAAQKVIEKAAEQGEPEEVYEDNTEKYKSMFLREVGATKWAPDYARAIRIQLELMERDAEDALLLM